MFQDEIGILVLSLLSLLGYVHGAASRVYALAIGLDHGRDVEAFPEAFL